MTKLIAQLVAIAVLCTVAAAGVALAADKPNFTGVWELNTELSDLLSGRYPRIVVEGEVSQLQVAASGHAYFTLRDKDPTNHRERTLLRPKWLHTVQRPASRPVVLDGLDAS